MIERSKEIGMLKAIGAAENENRRAVSVRIADAGVVSTVVGYGWDLAASLGDRPPDFSGVAQPESG